MRNRRRAPSMAGVSLPFLSASLIGATARTVPPAAWPVKSMGARIGHVVRSTHKKREDAMLDRHWIKAIMVTMALLTPGALAQAFNDAQYPDLKGQWNRMPPGNPRFDPTKPRGLEQL